MFRKMSFLKRTKRICPFLSAQKKRTKRKHHPPKALPQGRDATAPTRRSFIKVRLGIKALACFSNYACNKQI